MKTRTAALLSILMSLGFAQLASADEVIVTLRTLRTDPGANCLVQTCKNRNAIVFIHGVFGADDTWGLWPHLIMQDQRFAGYDIYLAGYPTSKLFWAPENKIRLTQVAEDFSRLLQNLTSYGNVYIIAHSMGGNIVTSSMIMLKLRNPNAHELLSEVTTILLGSPIDGTEVSKLGKLVSGDEKLIALEPAAENELPVLVEMGLKAINNKRRIIGLEPLLIWAGYELEPLPGLGIIVSQSSATKITEQNRTCGFHKNHITLVKPNGPEDPVYKWTADIILYRGDHVASECPISAQ